MKFTYTPIRYKLKILKDFILTIIIFLFTRDRNRRSKLKEDIKKYKIMLLGLE